MPPCAPPETALCASRRAHDEAHDHKVVARDDVLLDRVQVGQGADEAAEKPGRVLSAADRPERLAEIVRRFAHTRAGAETAIRLEVARTAVWQAAWASDHPEAIADRSLPDLPLQTVAQVFASEAIMKATKDATEIFGAMGVMRDMPLQKYIHDARVCQHSGDGNTDAKLRIAEELAGYRRAGNRAMALAGE